MADPLESIKRTTKCCDRLIDESQELVAQIVDGMERWRKNWDKEYARVLGGSFLRKILTRNPPCTSP